MKNIVIHDFGEPILSDTEYQRILEILNQREDWLDGNVRVSKGVHYGMPCGQVEYVVDGSYDGRAGDTVSFPFARDVML